MPVSTKNRFLLLYGSQTGQAKAISEEIVEKAEKFNLTADLHCLSQTEKKFNIERENCVVIVTSTTGDGEPPDTAQKFVRRLKKKTLPSNHLENLNYALLGLGDSNYTNFCNNGKTIDRRLEQLGAKRFYESGWADDAVGLEIAAEPWMESLFPAIQKFLSVNITTSCDSIDTSCRTNQSGSNENGHYKEEDRQENRLESKTIPDLHSDDSSPSITSLNEIIKPVSPLDNNCDKTTEVTSSKLNSRTNVNNLSSSHLGKSGSISNTDTDNIDSNTNINRTDNSTLITKSKLNINQQSELQTLDKGGCQPSLTISLPPLSESSVSVPVLSAAYLKLEYLNDETVSLTEIPLQNGCPMPSASSEITMARVTSSSVLTKEEAVKKTLCLKLNTEKKMMEYLPGDSISVVVENDVNEIEALLKRLNVLKCADTTCSLTVIEGTKKKNPSVPSHIPPLCTLRHIFTTCVDIREPPKKALFRVLVEYTSDQGQKRRIQELCSKQGAAEYTQFVRQPSLSLMDILNAFPSCIPPVERLLEHLPRLQPRPYSVCSSPLVNPGIIEIVFNVINIPVGEGRSYHRNGVCTGMLDKITQNVQIKGAFQEDRDDDLSNTLEKLAINDKIQVPIFTRTNQHFHMSDDLSIPIIMVGPGTGVAPFVGFLRHRQALRKDMSDPELYGNTWLFYGCRHEKSDYIYRKELEDFQSTGILSQLCVCFSRDNQLQISPQYVQDNIRNNSTELSILIMEKNATVFVCGDAKNMAKDVNEAFVSVIQSYKGCTAEEAKIELMKMRLHKRYLEDVWT
ncbi:methionine synthase reductase [Mytilus galloprovincialis]|uniref:Methionine synthase reductase n=1 Tax=Mytilus galloprovincialis TaxID=29158 RepID=A0A8B6BMC4_MYTGA|nr:methionine synthase reductase [Mytilus galloprovincialis]